MKVAARGDLVALIEAERLTVPPAEAFIMLDHLAMRTTEARRRRRSAA